MYDYLPRDRPLHPLWSRDHGVAAISKRSYKSLEEFDGDVDDRRRHLRAAGEGYRRLEVSSTSFSFDYEPTVAFYSFPRLKMSN